MANLMDNIDVRMKYRVLPMGNHRINPLTNVMTIGTCRYYLLPRVDDYIFVYENDEKHFEISLVYAFATRLEVMHVSMVILCMSNGIAVFVALVNNSTLVPFTVENATITVWPCIVHPCPISYITYNDKLYVSTRSINMQYVQYTYYIGISQLVRSDNMYVDNTTIMYYIDDDIMIMAKNDDIHFHIYNTQTKQHIKTLRGVERSNSGMFSYGDGVLSLVHYHRKIDQYRRYTAKLL